MIRDMLRTRLADALAHTLATKPFELTPGEDLERQVNLAMADAVLVVVAEWLREEAKGYESRGQYEISTGRYRAGLRLRTAALALAQLADAALPNPEHHATQDQELSSKG